MSIKSCWENRYLLYKNCFTSPVIDTIRRDQQLSMSHPKDTEMLGKRTCPTPKVSKRRHCGSNPRTLNRQSRTLTTELQRRRGKMRCRGRLNSFLPNRFICFECFSNIERKNEGIICNVKHEWQRRIPETPLAQPMSGLLTATCFDWPRDGDLRVRRCVIHGNYRSCSYQNFSVPVT